MTLDIITSDLLSPLRHGFFSRRGGASSGVFAGLNCGNGSTDQAEVVAINRARAAGALGLDTKALATLHQVHSARAVSVDMPPAPSPRADGLATATPGLGLAVLTADCQPVLLADTGNGVIGAAHAGWRGSLDGVLEATIDAMVGLGAERSAIRAVIGPSISQRNYEVGSEFLEDFIAADAQNARFFANGEGGRYHFDLPAYGLKRLRDAGIAEAEWTRHCTYADPDRFFSYRRSVHAKEADYGRLISIIRL